jgi:membrane fusion protein, copper/silver efflux system
MTDPRNTTETSAGSREPAEATRALPDEEQSPFGARRNGGTSRVLKIGAYSALLAVAIVVAFRLTRGEEEAEAAAGHSHGAAPAGDAASPVMLDPESARRIGVTYATATTGPLIAEVRTVGQVTYDETRVKAVSPKVDGWVEQLHVNFTGQAVREGEPLLSIYSPMLVTAQEELLLAARLANDVVSGTPEARQSAADLLASARRRLLYWDMSETEIDRIERAGEVRKTLTLRSTVHGVVVEKMVLGGQRIMAGESVYRIADLSTVWVEAEVFERELGQVRVGQQLSVEIEAYPGERWNGAVSYTYPLVDPTTRTARIRVAVPNAGLRLKPGMYATVRLPISQRARTLSVPRSAVLATGKRTLVFVRQLDGMLAPREVVTGVANDDRMEIISGLVEGDVVVSSATFLVDGESNLSAALGAMANMPGMNTGAPKQTPAPKAARDTSADMSGIAGMDMSPPNTQEEERQGVTGPCSSE